jgi:hypothetical protein
MSYKGYTIVRELTNMIERCEVNDDGTIGRVIEYIEDGSGEWFVVEDKDGAHVEDLGSLEEAKRYIDLYVEWLAKDDGTSFTYSYDPLVALA